MGKCCLPVQASVQQLRIGQSPEKAPVQTVSSKSLRQHLVLCLSDTGALCTHLNHFPRPSEPLGHVGGRVWGPLIAKITLPSKAHGHVGVQVERFGRGRVQLDDGREADFAGGGGHVYVEAIDIQTPADFTFRLERKTQDQISLIKITMK